MDFEKYGDYLIYFNPTEVENVHISAEYNLNEIIKIDKLIENINDITNISFIGQCKLISHLEEKDNLIIGVNIGLGIEYEENQHISRNTIELENYNIFKSDSILFDLNFYINTIAIRIIKYEIYISIIYSIYY